MTQTPAPPEVAPVGGGQQKASNGLALAGMVLGIVAIALFCVWWLSIPSAIVGLVLSVLGLQKSKVTGVGKGMAKVGLILSIVALALVVMALFGLLALLGLAKESGPEIGKALEEMAKELPAPPPQP